MMILSATKTKIILANIILKRLVYCMYEKKVLLDFLVKP